MASVSDLSRKSLLLVASIVLAVSGCTVSSEHPLVPLAESDPIPEYLLGSWEFVEIAGLNADHKEGGVVLGRGADDSLRIWMTENANTSELSASLAVVEDLLVLSIAPRQAEDRWFFASIAFDEATQLLTLNLLRHAVVVQDIQLGRVAGEVYQFDEADLARLSASPVPLRNYFAAHGGAAFSDRMMILRKLPSP